MDDRNAPFQSTMENPRRPGCLGASGGTDGFREKLGPSSYQAICWFHAHGHPETSPVNTVEVSCVFVQKKYWGKLKDRIRRITSNQR